MKPKSTLSVNLAPDLKRYGVRYQPGSWLKGFLSRPMVRFTTALRLCQRYGAKHPIGAVARAYYQLVSTRYGMQVPHVTRIGKGLFIGHWGNIVINHKAVIGNYCNIGQGVTLGYVSRGSKQGCPTLGDRVWIGANAVVVGNIRVGNDVLIAPLSFVNQDIPDRAVVVGNPGKIVSYNSSEGYLKYID